MIDKSKIQRQKKINYIYTLIWLKAEWYIYWDYKDWIYIKSDIAWKDIDDYNRYYPLMIWDVLDYIELKDLSNEFIDNHTAYWILSQKLIEMRTRKRKSIESQWIWTINFIYNLIKE